MDDEAPSPNQSAERRAMLSTMSGFCSVMCSRILGMSSSKMFGEHLVVWRMALIIGTLGFFIAATGAARAALIRRRLWTAEFVTALGLGVILSGASLVLLIRFLIY